MQILTLGKQGGAFANLRGWRGTGLGFARGRVAWCQVQNGLERRGRERGRPWEARVAGERMAQSDGMEKRGSTGTT